VKADITRSTFRREKHYSSVRMQQGRVQLDADWNEQVDITSHRTETSAVDVIGVCGAPKENAGFEVTADGSNLLIGYGKIYGDGILCENERNESNPGGLPFTDQPDLPETSPPTEPDGLYLAYLDVWQHHITVIEDPSIHDVALGADTTTRSKTVWQVKLLKLTDPASGNDPVLGDDPCEQEFVDWNNLVRSRNARMSARAVPLSTTLEDICLPQPQAGFRGLTNQLYRVEIHTPGQTGTAKFKWSRDNGSVVGRIKEIGATSIRLCEPPRDEVLAFKPSQWVEVIDDLHELRDGRGALVRLAKQTEGTTLFFDPATATEPISAGAFKLNPKVRRWDHVTDEPEIETNDLDWRLLEDGVQVKFVSGDEYHAGDYWLIPARTVTGNVDWPTAGGAPISQQREGIQHHYCRLALFNLSDGVWTRIQDCRKPFPTLTGICAEDVCFDHDHCHEEHPNAGWEEAETVQQALDKICHALRCPDFLDYLRADGIVAGADGELGFKVDDTDNPLEISYTAGRAYVGGCRYDIESGTLAVDPSTTHQTLLINAADEVELITKGELPEKYAAIAVISTYQGEIRRIIDARFDLTHLDKKVEQNFNRISAARTDRRQYVPLLTHSIKGLQFRDGRNRSFELSRAAPLLIKAPSGLAMDGENLWVANSGGNTIAKIPRTAMDLSEVEIFNLEIGGVELDDAESWAAAYDGHYLWFSLMNRASVIRLDPRSTPFEIREIQVASSPKAIAFDGDFIWVANYVSKSVSVIDVETCQVVRAIAMTLPNSTQTFQPESLTFDGSHIWITATPRALFRIEKPWGDLEQFPLPLNIVQSFGQSTFDGSHLWIASQDGNLLKIDVADIEEFKVLSEIDKISVLAFDGSSLWALEQNPINLPPGSSSTIYKIDVRTNQSFESRVIAGKANAAVFDGAYLWISTEIGVLRILI